MVVILDLNETLDRGVVTMRRWLEIARKGRKLMETSTEQVGFLSYRSDVASDLGVSKGTLHNYVAALKFIEDLRPVSPDTAAALETFPASAVAVYERWWRRDAAAVCSHIDQAVKEGWTSRKVIADEAKAREAVRPRSLLEIALGHGQHDSPRVTSPVIGEAFRRTGSAAPDFIDLAAVDNPNELSQALGVTQLLIDGTTESQPGPSLEIAVFEVGVGDSGRAHIRDARGILARATVAATVHTMALLLLQDVLAVADFGKALAAFKQFQISESSASLLGFELLPRSVVLVANADEFGISWTGAGESMWEKL